MTLAAELREALDRVDGKVEHDVWTDEELAAFLEEHPMIRTLLFEGFDLDEIMEAMDAGLMALAERSEGNPGNDPFSTSPLHDTTSAGKGGGDRPNGRDRTGECTGCSCSNYVCTCTCDGKDRTIDMTKYYKRGKKAYMAHWRTHHGKEHSR